ncbi:MAG TPA: hypothetical protein VGP80_15195 [Gemmatimonadales bacterium]|nr:hypothetical protein [Gemmatimonadales bacterium]
MAGEVFHGAANRWLAWLVLEGWPGLVLALVGAIIAGVIALNIPKRYTSEAVFIARGSGTSIFPSALQGLAATMGFDRGTDFSPKFYTDLLTSRVIMLSVVHDSFQVSPGQPRQSYIEISGIKADNPALADEAALKRLARKLSARADVRTGITTVRVTARSPTLCHDVLQRLLQALDSMNVSFRQQQSRDLRIFFETRVQEAQNEMDQAENEHRRFLERNRIIRGSPMLELEDQRLSRQVDIKGAVYQTVIQQYEQSRIQEARNVPILTVLSPPNVPASKSGPSRKGIVLLGALLGFLAWVGVLAVRYLLQRFVREQPRAARVLRLDRAIRREGVE